MLRSDIVKRFNDDILDQFRFQHLPQKQWDIVLPLCNIALTMDEELPNCPEKTAGLRKLLEAKNFLLTAVNTKEENQHA